MVPFLVFIWVSGQGLWWWSRRKERKQKKDEEEKERKKKRERREKEERREEADKWWWRKIWESELEDMRAMRGRSRLNNHATGRRLAGRTKGRNARHIRPRAPKQVHKKEERAHHTPVPHPQPSIFTSSPFFEVFNKSRDILQFFWPTPYLL
ncbi:hypothetical protein BGX38DRAFT_1141129 [Terfezia claveryi]|nr:hypothetical protein BGX38DRAFT_1141129 [Terfezia claveryi]